MGWKASCIFVLPKEKQDLDLVKSALGFDKMKKSEPEPFELAINPYGKCYIGYLDDKLIICHPGWPYEITSGDSKILDILNKLYPKSKILAIGLLSSINYYSYAFYEEGELIRKKYGDSDETVREDIGELLPTEKEFIKQQIIRIEKDGLRNRYFFEEDSEGYEDDAIGENFVSCVTKEIFEYELFEMDEHPLFDIELEGFELKKEHKESKTTTQNDLTSKRMSRIKQYGKLAIIVLCVFLIRKLGGC